VSQNGGQYHSFYLWWRSQVEGAGTAKLQVKILSFCAVRTDLFLKCNMEYYNNVLLYKAHLARYRNFSRLMTYICMLYRTANLQMLHFMYLSTNIRTEYFEHAAHSLFFPLQNVAYFIMLPFLVPVLFTF